MSSSLVGRANVPQPDAVNISRSAIARIVQPTVSLLGKPSTSTHSALGYCLMSNHVHPIVVPSTTDGLAQALKQTHGRYACYWNAVHEPAGMYGEDEIILVRWTNRICREGLRYTELESG